MSEKNKIKKPNKAEPESQNLPNNISSEKPKPNSYPGIPPDEISAIIKKDGTVVGLDGEVKENIEISRQVTFARSAPLPPPQEFEGFERILPGSAERILNMAEAQQFHQHHMEIQSLSIDKLRIEASIHDNEHMHALEKRGQWFGLIIAIILIFAGLSFGLMSYPTSGTLIITTCLVGLVAVFVIGRKLNNADKLEQQENSD